MRNRTVVPHVATELAWLPSLERSAVIKKFMEVDLHTTTTILKLYAYCTGGLDVVIRYYPVLLSGNFFPFGPDQRSDFFLRSFYIEFRIALCNVRH
jgi:hypothetical protein